MFSYSCYLEMLHENDHRRIQGLFVGKMKRSKIGTLSPILECHMIKSLSQVQMHLVLAPDTNVEISNDTHGTRILKEFLKYLRNILSAVHDV